MSPINWGGRPYHEFKEHENQAPWPHDENESEWAIGQALGIAAEAGLAIERMLAEELPPNAKVGSSREDQEDNAAMLREIKALACDRLIRDLTIALHRLDEPCGADVAVDLAKSEWQDIVREEAEE